MNSLASEESSARYSVALGGHLGSISCNPDIPFSSNKFSYVYESNSFGSKVKQCNDSRSKTCPLFDKSLISSDNTIKYGCKSFNVTYFLNVAFATWDT
ncbi:hypothetical protein AVEN_266393-1 [Araneus ventricosus]|uniref:Uncharacterized protein n=1 Tax=Araneus ventricosus TaxID=182803 RepID=A0A4Y2F7S7_ARAVE|nr:hypothetical protein AVEN_266393-1 [Araneus ventricosus]